MIVCEFYFQNHALTVHNLPPSREHQVRAAEPKESSTKKNIGSSASGTQSFSLAERALVPPRSELDALAEEAHTPTQALRRGTSTPSQEDE